MSRIRVTIILLHISKTRMKRSVPDLIPFNANYFTGPNMCYHMTHLLSDTYIAGKDFVKEYVKACNYRLTCSLMTPNKGYCLYLSFKSPKLRVLYMNSSLQKLLIKLSFAYFVILPWHVLRNRKKINLPWPRFQPLISQTQNRPKNITRDGIPYLYLKTFIPT